MTVHNKGQKAEMDRAILLHSYEVMCREFRVPKNKVQDSAALARMSNDILYRLNKDLYSRATVKQAHKLAVRMGLADKPDTYFARIWRKIKASLFDSHPERSECHSSTREAARA